MRIAVWRHSARLMHNCSSQFDVSTAVQEGLVRTDARGFSLLRSLFLLLSLALAGGSATPGASAQNAWLASAGSARSFAIADFDGDHRPDLADVQRGQNSFTTSSYWIGLRLSTVGRQYIRLVAPPGGLAIEARDVNGDRNVDLVVRTEWFSQPVAIFLNDGHGNFSRAKPASFQEAFNPSNLSWGSTSNREEEAVAAPAPSQSRDGACPEGSASAPGRSLAGLTLASLSRFLVSPFLISHAGRAPPSEVLYL